MEPLVVPQGVFALDRYPVRPGDRLRAWDAADELLLRHVDAVTPSAPATTVVLDDAWGALATALAARAPVVVSDSYLARRAIAANVRRAGVADGAGATAGVTILADVDRLPERVDLAVVRVPKSLALLRHQLRGLARHLHPQSVVVGAGMIKHLPPGAHLLFQELIGPTNPSRAEKKARLIHCQPDTDLVGPDRPSTPAPPIDSFVLEAEGLTLVGHPGVFSSARLDIGTRVLLAQLPRDMTAAHGPARIVDLGCCNGVVGLVGALRNPHAEVVFVDDSSLAVRSATTNWRAAFGDTRHARFVEGNGLADVDGDPIEPGSVDLVVTNPPFHREHTVGDQTAWQFFVDAHHALRPGGVLLVVGNRHLAYHVKVTRLFGEAEVVASDPKFVVLRAQKR